MSDNIELSLSLQTNFVLNYTNLKLLRQIFQFPLSNLQYGTDFDYTLTQVVEIHLYFLQFEQNLVLK